ncbi:hypothetical protein TWF730_003981 [Orbilia blumenaviensis]|uniref:Uncharacterized protein n=1 Tax=Orbilia blumenaviensis TaxID=1796055 RepID=A0AAV9U3N3_9PEZI
MYSRGGCKNSSQFTRPLLLVTLPKDNPYGVFVVSLKSLQPGLPLRSFAYTSLDDQEQTENGFLLHTENDVRPGLYTWKLDLNDLGADRIREFFPNVTARVPDPTGYVDQLQGEYLAMWLRNLAERAIYWGSEELDDPLENYMGDIISGKIDADSKPSKIHGPLHNSHLGRKSRNEDLTTAQKAMKNAKIPLILGTKEGKPRGRYLVAPGQPIDINDRWGTGIVSFLEETVDYWHKYQREHAPRKVVEDKSKMNGLSLLKDEITEEQIPGFDATRLLDNLTIKEFNRILGLDELETKNLGLDEASAIVIHDADLNREVNGGLAQVGGMENFAGELRTKHQASVPESVIGSNFNRRMSIESGPELDIRLEDQAFRTSEAPGGFISRPSTIEVEEPISIEERMNVQGQPLITDLEPANIDQQAMGEGLYQNNQDPSIISQHPIIESNQNLADGDGLSVQHRAGAPIQNGREDSYSGYGTTSTFRAFREQSQWQPGNPGFSRINTGGYFAQQGPEAPEDTGYSGSTTRDWRGGANRPNT